MNTVVIEIRLLGREIDKAASDQFLAYWENGANRIVAQLAAQGIEATGLVYLAQRNETGKTKKKAKK